MLTVDGLPALLRTLSPARCQLVEALRKAGPLSIYELSKRLGRNYKNVHTDVSQLSEVGVIERDAQGLVSVPWDLLRAELAF